MKECGVSVSDRMPALALEKTHIRVYGLTYVCVCVCDDCLQMLYQPVAERRYSVVGDTTKSQFTETKAATTGRPCWLQIRTKPSDNQAQTLRRCSTNLQKGSQKLPDDLTTVR